jgi:hypothetical protein
LVRTSQNYYRAEQQLAKIIGNAIRSEPSLEFAGQLYEEVMQLTETMTEPTYEDLYDVIRRFGNWLDDGDIRLKDKEYAKCTTDWLRDWCSKNNDSEV